MEPLFFRRLSLSLCLCLACVAAALAVEEPPSRRSVQFTERGAFRVYPEVLNSSLFLSPLLNFDALSDQIVIGAADNLFILNRNLSLSSSVSWPSDPQSRQDCISTNDNNEESIECRNHVSIYEAIPGSDDSLFVCGTGAHMPKCRTLEVSSSSGDVLLSSDSQAAPGLLSPSPDLPSFGEFRRRPTNLNGGALDLRYFSVGFQSTSIDSFDLSYQSVAVQPGDNTVATQRLYGLKSSDSQWMADPATFVDFYRADYAPLNMPEDYQFYFVFLREQLVLNSASQNVIISRVLRICRNDPGVSVTTRSGEEQVFSTFIKARILCEREVPPGIVGALDFQYNDIRSVGFNSRGGGRYTENGEWKRFMYGAFSGAALGPVGTAICLYEAGNSENFGGGIFDIFREDVQLPDGGGESQNDFLECDPVGRNSQEAELVTIVRDVRQEGEDPILVFDGFFVSQIIVDSVCVVSSTNRTTCLDQDVLWLGTSVGSVMKVVFTSDRSPLVLEDIQLTDDGTAVNDLKLETVVGVKYLFVATQRRVYRLPLEKCSTYSFNECISSQDPYCVWNSLVGECQLNTLVANQEGAIPFPSFLVQNIHTGMVDISTRETVVTLVEGSPSVSGRNVTVTFNTTNRNLLSPIICRIEGPGRSLTMLEDCSSGQARFQNLDDRSGRFTLIIEGQLLNGSSISLVERAFRFDSRICSVHVINSVVVRNNVATIEWQATGPSEAGRPTTFSCRLDRRVTQECSSPFIWSGLSPGPHRLRVRPAVVPGCTRASNTVVLFEN